MKAARQASCDLPVMGTPTHGWLMDALLDGLSEQALAENEMPIPLYA
jgi:hypothetical protein